MCQLQSETLRGMANLCQFLKSSSLCQEISMPQKVITSSAWVPESVLKPEPRLV